MQEKLNVLAEALAALMESRASHDRRLLEEVERLREAVGLEDRAPGDRAGRYTGTTPWRLNGRSTRLPSVRASVEQMTRRVSRGSMTSSIMALRAAT